MHIQNRYKTATHETQGQILQFINTPIQTGTLILDEKPILDENGWRNIIKHAQRSNQWKNMKVTKGQYFEETDERYRKWILKHASINTEKNETEQTVNEKIQLLHVCDTNAHEINDDTTTKQPNLHFKQRAHKHATGYHNKQEKGEMAENREPHQTQDKHIQNNDDENNGDSENSEHSHYRKHSEYSENSEHSHYRKHSEYSDNSDHSHYSKHSEYSEDSEEEQEYHTLLYQMASLPSHSCLPNSFIHINPHTRRAEIRNIRNINNEEQITINYLDEEYLPRKYRRRMILGRRGFDCTCDMCIGTTIPEYSEPGVCSKCSKSEPIYRYHNTGIWKCHLCEDESYSTEVVATGVSFWENCWSNMEDKHEDASVEKLIIGLSNCFDNPKVEYGFLPSLTSAEFGLGSNIHISHSVIYNALRVLSTTDIIATRWGEKASWGVMCYLAGVGRIICKFVGQGSEESRWSAFWLLHNIHAREHRRSWYDEASLAWRTAMEVTRGIQYDEI
jgi:hypothetical protein